MKKTISILLTILMVLSAVPMLTFAEDTEHYKTGDHIQYGNYPQSQETDEEILAQLDSVEKNWVSYEYYANSKENCEKLINDEYIIKDGLSLYPYATPSDFMRYSDIDLDGDGKRDYRAVTFDSYRMVNTTWTFEDIESELSVFNDEILADFEYACSQYAGGYYAGNVYYFRFEPITWRVLDPDEGLIMSENVLDAQAYHNFFTAVITLEESESENDNLSFFGNEELTQRPSDYTKSSVREWLNADFYNTAFTEEQKANIRDDVAIINDSVAKFYANITCKDGSVIMRDDVLENTLYQYEETYDKVFLLSSMEVVNPDYGFERDNYSEAEYDWDLSENESRKASHTDYCISQGLYDIGWWLRTPSYNGDPDRIMADAYANFVSLDGTYMPANYQGGFSHPTNHYFGIRPACRLYTLEDNTEKSYIEGYHPTSGQCGDNAYWSFDEETGTLTITGTGETWYCDDDDDDEIHKLFVEHGWYKYREEIKNIIVEDGITAIDPYTIIDLNFETVTFGKSFDIDGIKDFNGASLFYRYVKDYSVSDENPYFKSVDGVIFSKDGKILYSYPKNNDRKEYIIPDGVETISEYSFGAAYKLESVIMPEGVKKINHHAFMYSSNIRNVKMPSTLKYIGEFSFGMCFNLNIELPEGAENLIIDDNAFSINKTQSIVIPEGVVSVGEDSFSLEYSPRNIINKSKTFVCPDFEYYFEEPYEAIYSDFVDNYYNFVFNDENYSLFEDEVQIDLKDNAYFKAKKLVLEKYGEEYSVLFDDEKLSFDFDVLEQHALPEDSRVNTYLNITCLEDSAQHQYCIENNINHTILNSNCDDACNIHNVYENEYIAPTCTENGYQGGKVCLDCEKVFETPEIIKPTGHKAEAIAAVNPTCTKDGLTEGSVCETCGKVISGQEVVPATGHNDSNGDDVCDSCGEKLNSGEEKNENVFQRIISRISSFIDRIVALFRRLFK